MELFVKLRKIVGYVFAAVLIFILVVLGLEIILTALDADPEAPLIGLIYALGGMLQTPFVGAFDNVNSGILGERIDERAMLALIIYVIILITLYFILSLLGRMFTKFTSTEAADDASY